ncbi:hypothetical protein PISMIDRAFT_24464 [Pisolithus microcarpus 441]|uniref:Uncharacterized protein n=1 Tax=Pisolithus microcarpus 441 TaxID=765257 RepID=A0A0C9Z9V4_9AGAM|nr:hypothetical protein BKA83DRAFT_24464 [Pisolithus microcarpus]KIK19257.1 hypothetical protein PISMIDRAFT_24464 [Pisolithus microcarpus 441]
MLSTALPPILKLQKSWAKGACLLFLTDHLEAYKAAAAQGHTCGNDYVDNIVNQYFQQFSWCLPLSHEPSEGGTQDLTIASDALTPEEEQCKKAIVGVMRKSISSWLSYHASKNANQLIQAQDVAKNPITRLMGQLSGIQPRQPKRLHAEQQWSKVFYKSKVKSAFEEHWASAGLSKKHHAAKHTKFTSSCFACEDADVHQEWVVCAQQEHKKALKEWEAALEAPPPTNMQSCQDAIDHLGGFVGPIIHSYMVLVKPWACTFEADKTKFKLVTNASKDYLNTCYTKEEQLLCQLFDADYDNEENLMEDRTPPAKCNHICQKKVKEASDSAMDSTADEDQLSTNNEESEADDRQSHK